MPAGPVVQAGWRGKARRTVSFRHRARVAGRVLGAGGVPVAGAQVVLLDDRTGRPLRTGTTGARGRYRLRAPATRTRRLIVWISTGCRSAREVIRCG